MEIPCLGGLIGLIFPKEAEEVSIDHIVEVIEECNPERSERLVTRALAVTARQARRGEIIVEVPISGRDPIRVGSRVRGLKVVDGDEGPDLQIRLRNKRLINVPLENALIVGEKPKNRKGTLRS